MLFAHPARAWRAGAGRRDGRQADCERGGPCPGAPDPEGVVSQADAVDESGRLGDRLAEGSRPCRPRADRLYGSCESFAGGASAERRVAGGGLDGRFALLAHLFAAAAIFLIRLYQRTVSPLLGDRCRFSPSCSQYGIEAFSKHGFCKGLFLTAARLLRCGPWHPGGYDPVPEAPFLLRERVLGRAGKRTGRSKARESVGESPER